MIAEKIPQLQTLSVEEKLLLVEELWDELTALPGLFPPRDDHIKILRERIEAYKEDSSSATAWEEVKRRILASR